MEALSQYRAGRRAGLPPLLRGQPSPQVLSRRPRESRRRPLPLEQHHFWMKKKKAFQPPEQERERRALRQRPRFRSPLLQEVLRPQAGG